MCVVVVIVVRRGRRGKGRAVSFVLRFVSEKQTSRRGNKEKWRRWYTRASLTISVGFTGDMAFSTAVVMGVKVQPGGGASLFSCARTSLRRSCSFAFLYSLSNGDPRGFLRCVLLFFFFIVAAMLPFEGDEAGELRRASGFRIDCWGERSGNSGEEMTALAATRCEGVRA